MRASLILLLALLAGCAGLEPRATGDLGIVIERANGSAQLINTTQRAAIAQIPGLGDMSHA